jgi:hypothetical protein
MVTIPALYPGGPCFGYRLGDRDYDRIFVISFMTTGERIVLGLMMIMIVIIMISCLPVQTACLIYNLI